MKDARVVALRKRLDVAGDKDNQLYDDAVRDAVKTFQTESDIGVDGNLGPNTVRALNGEQKEAPSPVRQSGRYDHREHGALALVCRAIWAIRTWSSTSLTTACRFTTTARSIGKPGSSSASRDKATPLVSAEMKFITVNPTWNVPPSIIEKEYLPALQEDPQALDRIGLKLSRMRMAPFTSPAARRRQRARPHPLQLPQ